MKSQAIIAKLCAGITCAKFQFLSTVLWWCCTARVATTDWVRTPVRVMVLLSHLIFRAADDEDGDEEDHQ